MLHPSPFLDPAFADPKDITTKRGESRSEIRLYHRANFYADRHTSIAFVV